jgi:hypothetical protein
LAYEDALDRGKTFAASMLDGFRRKNTVDRIE